jgi:hypothetical protein
VTVSPERSAHEGVALQAAAVAAKDEEAVGDRVVGERVERPRRGRIDLVEKGEARGIHGEVHAVQLARVGKAIFVTTEEERFAGAWAHGHATGGARGGHVSRRVGHRPGAGRGIEDPRVRERGAIGAIARAAEQEHPSIGQREQRAVLAGLGALRGPRQGLFPGQRDDVERNGHLGEATAAVVEADRDREGTGRPVVRIDRELGSRRVHRSIEPGGGRGRDGDRVAFRIHHGERQLDGAPLFDSQGRAGSVLQGRRVVGSLSAGAAARGRGRRGVVRAAEGGEGAEREQGGEGERQFVHGGHGGVGR